MKKIAFFLFAPLMLCAMSSTYAGAQREMYPRKMGVEKVKPLTWDPWPKWVTFDMEIRGRTEEQTALNYVSGKDRLYELTRVRGGLTARPVSWLTAYMQFQDAHALGLPLRDVAANQRDAFDLRQGYLDLHTKNVHFFAGRQELKFGDERVVGISDWTNTSRTWDGFDLRLGQKNTVDIFSTSVVLVHPTSLDTHGAGLTFHGVEGNIATLIPHTVVQPFVLIRAEPRVLSQQGIYGTETEVTPGLHWDSKLPVGFDTSGMADLQRGSYSNDSIHAGSAIIRFGWVASHHSGRPHIEYEYDYATGNAHTNASRISTYDQQYPSNHNAFGLVDLFGFQNIKQNRLNFTLAPRPNMLFALQAESLHLATTGDGIYASGGTKTFGAPSSGFLQDGIGTGLDLSFKHVWSESFVTNTGIGHFFPGYVMTSSKHGAPETIAFLQLTYRFKLDKASDGRLEVEKDKHSK
ncbi:MAG: alginate export family protein [Acidobacteriaceae bacterium]|nr:alginate export family protein [Acidobacteriaceae bacterium]